MTHRTLDAGPDRLRIDVMDEPGKGGPEHRHSNLYRVSGPLDLSQNPSWQGDGAHSVMLLLQNGPLVDGRPANGLTETALLAILIDRFRSRKAHTALHHCEAALEGLRVSTDG